MTKRDYLRQVDALDLSPTLRARLQALPYRPAAKAASRRRLGAIAAALILLAGLGVAAPTLYGHLRVGGELDPPPVLSEAPAISDEELAALLAAEFPNPMENDTYSLLYSATQRGRTMGTLLYRGGEHYVLGTIIVGVFDNETKAPVGEIQIHTGDVGEAAGYLSRERVAYLLWTNGSGRDEGWGAGLYAFSRGELTAVTEFPPYMVEGTLPEGALTMFGLEKNTAFWADHKAAINGAGLDIYSRNPEYHYIRNHEVDEWLLACSIQFQFSTGPDAAPAISDEESAGLLAAQFPEPGANDSWALYSYSTAPGYSMGVLNYQTTDPDGYERGAFILGAFDNATKQPSGQIHLFGGAPFESREISFFPDGEVEPGNEFFLCIRQTTGATPSSIFYHASLYRFDGRAVKEVTAPPKTALPDGMEDMFDRAKNDAFWQEHKIIIAPSGFEVFHRNPDWNRPDLPQQPLWVFDAYVLLGDQGPSTTVMETARRYFEDYYAGEFGGSSDYPIISCESVLDYDKGLYGENSSAYHVMLEDHEGRLERYFFLDETGELLEVRDSLQHPTPWSSYADSLSQISIEGVPFGGLFGDLDESIRATLEDTGEIEDLGETHPEWVTPWMVKTYRNPSLEVCTATAPPDLLEQYLAEGRITRKQYDRVLGAEYVYQVRPLDGTYATEAGLRLGDSVAQARKLSYHLPDTGVNIYARELRSLTITTENGVVTDLVSDAGTRAMGEGIFY